VAFDLVIRGADVYPGDGPCRRADVGILDGRIESVAPDLPVDAAGQIVEGAGLLLCSGFIDMHAHSALEPFRDPLLTPKIAQGFTTEAINPDGLVPAPVAPERRAERRSYLMALEGPGAELDAWTWSTFDEYLAALETTGPATTLVPSVGHSAVRDFVMGSEDRQPTGSELAQMRREVRTALECGARTLSFGLVYVPGVFASTEELVALAEEAAAFGAPLVPHVRTEAEGVLAAIGEMIEVARRTGAPLHLSHLKVVGNPHLIEPLLELLGEAGNDVDLSFDQYPYGAGSTMLTALLPPWSQSGGPSAILARLASPDERERIAHDAHQGLPGWENLYRACGAEQIFIAHAAPPRDNDAGKSLAQLGEERSCEPYMAALGILADTQLDVLMIDYYASEEAVRTIFRHQLALVGSDGIPGLRPHPRLYGTAARVLGRYALREGIVSVEEAVARLTARAARRLGLPDRGRIAPGLRADVVLLDPSAYVDSATYEDPRRTPAGVRGVFVGGRLAYADGNPTGERSGGVVRSPRRT
jgi:N-acyl-D-amino-acid deacylase